MDLKVVKVEPVVREADKDGFLCAGVDQEGNLYVWGILKHFLPKEKVALITCFDDKISDEDFLNSFLQVIENS
jgi:hypothetical protein